MRLILFIFCLSLTQLSIGQERAGLTYGQYNGVNALNINPAFSFNSKNKWDVQLAGAQLFAETNYARISNATPISLLQADSDDILVRDNLSDLVDHDYPMEVFFNESGKTFIDTKTEALGPGMLFSIGEKFKVGISTRAKAIAASYKIPAMFNYYSFDNLDSSLVYQVEPAQGQALAYAELDLHGAMQVSESINIGATIKILRGLAGFSVRNEATFDLTKINENNLDILSDGHFTVQHSVADESNSSGFDLGIGMDLGITFSELWGKGSQLGVSLLDLGYINFQGFDRTYGFDTALELDSGDYEEIDEAAELDAQLAQDFTILLRTESFYVMLPAALSIQYRQKINDHTSVEGHLVQRLKVVEMQMPRSNSLNVTGVYDRKHFSAFLPVTLYNYNDLRVGAAIRLGPLTIGSDHIMSFFKQTDLSGTDVYVNLQVYPFELFGEGKKSGGKNSKKNVSCYW